VYLRESGRALFVKGAEHEALLARIRSFHGRGMSYAQMEGASGVSRRTIANMMSGPRAGVRRHHLVALMKMPFRSPDPHVWVGPEGTRRRLSALWLEGYSLPWLADRLEFASRGYLQALIRGSKGVSGVRYSTASAVSALYDELAGHIPGEFGVESCSQKRATAFARKRGIAPRSCWDSDTIDDPEASPEWTGRCGTSFGRRIHELEGIPVCGPCAEAEGLGDELVDPERLLKLRLRSGLSQQQLARKADVTVWSYRTWETGRNQPRFADQLERVLVILDATFEDVIK
jgi:transcriptional regulator with XRE-family HTH domain